LKPSKAVTIIPLLLLVVSIAIAQVAQTGRLPGRLSNVGQLPITYAHNRWEGLLLMAKNFALERAPKGLELMGYNFDKDLTQASVTLWYRGDSLASISQVIYDGEVLAEGLRASSYQQPSNDLIFAAAGHWNLDTGGPVGSSIQPNTVVVLYLGVATPVPGSQHTLEVIIGGQAFNFTLKA
jgi:hypothetical protein